MDDRVVVIYHANCTDGIAAAWVADCYFRSKGPVTFIPKHYGESIDDLFREVEGAKVFILDFSFKKEIMIKLKELAGTLLCLDHHRSAQKELEGLDFAVFDMERSGAMMAFNHFYPNVAVPEFIKYVEDYDLWRFKLQYSREINAYIQSWPQTFESMDMIHGSVEFNKFQCFEHGVTLLRQQEIEIDKAVKHAMIINLGGYAVPFVNTPHLISKVGEALCQDHPFSASCFLRRDGKWQFSLRSRKDGIDVSEVAKTFGGGGHRNAAGFELTYEEFFELLHDNQ